MQIMPEIKKQQNVMQILNYLKLEIHSVERGICAIATSTMMNELFL